MIRYYKLFDMMNRRGMKKTELLKIMSSPTLAKLGKGDIIKTDIIDKICLLLNCQPGDIMECISEIDNNEFEKSAYKEMLNKGIIDEETSLELIRNANESIIIKKPILREEIPGEFEEDTKIEERKKESTDN